MVDIPRKYNTLLWLPVVTVVEAMSPEEALIRLRKHLDRIIAEVPATETISFLVTLDRARPEVNDAYDIEDADAFAAMRRKRAEEKD